MAKELKQHVIDEISRAIGRPRRLVSNGSTEPKQIFVDIVEALQLSLDTGITKPQLAEAIARLGGMTWDSTCDSRQTTSGGGSTVSLVGLQRVRASVHALAAATNEAGPPLRLLAEADSSAGETLSHDIVLRQFRSRDFAGLKAEAFQRAVDPTNTRRLMEKAIEGHVNLLAAIAAAAFRNGGSCSEDPASVDLVIRIARDCVLVEVKTLGGSPVTAVRQGLAQLYEYAYRLRNTLCSSPILALAFDRALERPVWIRDYLTQARGVNLIWPAQGGFAIEGEAAGRLRKLVS